MSNLVIEIQSEAVFKQQIQTGLVLVDFFATWCGPCRMQLPILESLTGKMQSQVTIIKINTDTLPSVAQAYNISNIPTLILFKDGQEVNRFVGLQQEAALENAIKTA